jgi:uncharacterized membrane protein YhaH (DUF805 family)
MTFKESIVHVFENYSNHEERASRSEYWWWYLFSLLIRFTITTLQVAFDNHTAISLFVLPITILMFIPDICVSIRRCHDSGHSGWWIICPIVNIVMMFLPSDPEENEYGLPEGMATEE